MALSTSKTTPLHRAVLSADTQQVKYLIEQGAPLIVDANGNTPLHLAFILKHHGIVDLLLAALQRYSVEDSKMNVINRQGLSHFHIACTTNNKGIIKQYLENGASVDAMVNKGFANWAGYTPLHFAASFKSTVATEMLIKAGANPSITDVNGKTPLELANEQLVQLAMVVDALSKTNNSYNDMSYFHTACLKNDSVTLKKFIENGVNVNAVINPYTSYFNPEYTALHFAVLNNNTESVKLLLQHGADVGRQCSDGQTPLHLAFYQEKFGCNSLIVDLLYEALQRAGMQLEDMEDNNKLGFFHVAITRNKLRLVEEFLDDSEDVNRPVLDNTPNFPAYAPLHFAVRYRLHRMAQMLIRRGADVNRVSGDGTPLHLAFEVGHVDLIKLLLRNGADATAVRSKDKTTMLHLLVERYIEIKRKGGKNEENEMLLEYIPKLICEHRVDVNALSNGWPITNNRNDTALHIAFSHLPFGGPCLKLLLENGANINVTNVLDMLPLSTYKLKDLTDNNYADFLLIYHHIQNLKALGLPLHHRNVEWCQEFIRKKNELNSNVNDLKDTTLAQLEKQRLKEIKTMKMAILHSDTTFYDILVQDRTTHLNSIPVSMMFINKVVENGCLNTLYPCYGYIIQLKLRKYRRA